MWRTNAGCQQKQHLVKHLVTRINARALARLPSKTSSKVIETACKVVNNRNDIDDPEVMLEEEKNRSSSRFNTNGKRQGFGL